MYLGGSNLVRQGIALVEQQSGFISFVGGIWSHIVAISRLSSRTALPFGLSHVLYIWLVWHLTMHVKMVLHTSDDYYFIYCNFISLLTEQHCQECLLKA